MLATLRAALERRSRARVHTLAEQVERQSYLLPRARLDDLIQLLIARGYRVQGPTLRDGAIVLGPLRSDRDLPIGFTDEQRAGHYRVVPRQDVAVFGYVVGPHSFKAELLRPAQTLFRAKREAKRVRFIAEAVDDSPLCLFGARACDLAAIEVQDGVLRDSQHPDAFYAARRAASCIVAVGCTQSAPTCFCASMGTGPAPTRGYDLALTELIGDAGHRFVVAVGTRLGADLVGELGLALVPADDADLARAALRDTRRNMRKSLETTGLQEMLAAAANHPHWDDVAARCLACTNCTQVCPTCFCVGVEDRVSLDGSETERVRHWDSCFSAEYSKLHGGAVRASVRARYRQWLTHKLSTWFDQFGRSGCVGCGRCITFCPAAIDLTEEVQALRAPVSARTRARGDSSNGN